MNHLQQKAFLDDLFYLLSGFDTQNIFVISHPPALSTTIYDLNLFKPFEFLIFKIREFYSISEFDSFVQEYLEKVAMIRMELKTLDEIYVALQPEVELFRDLTIIQQEYMPSTEMWQNDQLIKNKLMTFKNGSLMNISQRLAKKFQSKGTLELLSCINRWINQGDPSHIIEVLNPEGFNSFFWGNLFKIKKVALPKRELEGIEETGKAVFFARTILGIELVDDECFKIKDENLDKNDQSNKSEGISINSCQLDNINKPNEFALNNNNELFNGNQQCSNNELFKENQQCRDIYEDIVEVKKIKINNLQITDKDPIPFQPFYYNNDISIRRFQIMGALSSIVEFQMRNEISIIQNFVFLQDSNSFNKFLNLIKKEIFTDQNITKKINSEIRENITSSLTKFANLDTDVSAYPIINDTSIENSKVGFKSFNNLEFIEFVNCENSFGSYVMKLLKSQQIPQIDTFLTNFQRIGIEFNSSLLQYFVPERSFVEMKIIFRFLFLINSGIFYLQESKSYNFTRVLYLILLKIKEEKIDLLSEYFKKAERKSKNENKPKLLFSNFSIDAFVSDFSKLISNLIKKFYLTNIEVFPFWSDLLDTLYAFLIIEYKECIIVSDFNIKVKACVLGLINTISRYHGENEFTEYLKNLEVEKYL